MVTRSLKLSDKSKATKEVSCKIKSSHNSRYLKFMLLFLFTYIHIKYWTIFVDHFITPHNLFGIIFSFNTLPCSNVWFFYVRVSSPTKALEHSSYCKSAKCFVNISTVFFTFFSTLFPKDPISSFLTGKIFLFVYAFFLPIFQLFTKWTYLLLSI